MRRTVIAAAMLGGTAWAQGPELIATITVPATASDLSGLKEVLGGDVPHDRLGGFGSAIDRVEGDTYIVLPDRGPRDGATSYRCRMHVATIKRGTSTKDWAFTLTRTVMLVDERGRPFVGSSGAYAPSGPADGSQDARLDPEGVRVGPDGTVYVADEYGPRVLAFSAEGKLLRRMSVPERYLPGVRDGLEDGEMPPKNMKGRQPNRGFEGLARTAAGTLVAFLQNPLIQDSALDEGNEKIGRFIRVLNFEASGATVEWAYPLRSPQYATNELLAVTDRVFLAIERDNREGESARSKRVVKVDFTEATDVSKVEELPPLKLPAEIRAGKVSTLIDLLDPALGVSTAASPIPAKIEGLCFGPDLPDGRRTLLVTSDNDFKPLEPSYIWVFAVDPEQVGSR